jgi:hypothetical protein
MDLKGEEEKKCLFLGCSSSFLLTLPTFHGKLSSSIEKV